MAATSTSFAARRTPPRLLVFAIAPPTLAAGDMRRGRVAARYNVGNWVSSETSAEHWIELYFTESVRVTTVYVFWGFDKERYMPSRRVELQASDGAGAWRTVSSLEPGDNFDRAAFEFQPFEAKAVRVFQPAQSGPSNRPFVMWLRELQVFGGR